MRTECKLSNACTFPEITILEADCKSNDQNTWGSSLIDYIASVSAISCERVLWIVRSILLSSYGNRHQTAMCVYASVLKHYANKAIHI